MRALFCIFAFVASVGYAESKPDRAPERIRDVIKRVRKFTRMKSGDIPHERLLRVYLNRLAGCVVGDRLARNRIKVKRQKYMLKYAFRVNSKATPGKIERVIASLSVPDKGERQVATEKLFAIGGRALPWARKELKDTTDADTKARLELFIVNFDGTATFATLRQCLNRSVNEFYFPYLERGFPSQPILGCEGKALPEGRLRLASQFFPKALVNRMGKVYIDRKRRKGIGLEVAVKNTYLAMLDCYKKDKPNHLWDIQLTPGEKQRGHRRLEGCLKEAASRIPQKILVRFYPKKKLRVCEE